MGKAYDALIMTTAPDFIRLQNNYHRLARYMEAKRLIFVGSEEVGRLVEAAALGEKVGFINENDVLPFAKVHTIMTEQMQPLLQGRELPRGVTGWYYQQFLKMQYALICEDEYYMVWDGDTIPCGAFSMFKEDTDIPYIDLKREFHEEYFITMGRLIPGMKKCIEKSFIAEHMLIKSDIMKALIHDIENNTTLPGTCFWEKIIRSIEAERIQNNAFSEFETYGTYVCFHYPEAYRLRDWYSFRQAGEFFNPDKITDEDYLWLSRDFYAVSFEKGHFVREDHQNLFDNKRYQEKLTARQMLEIAQEEFKEGYKEVWDEPSVIIRKEEEAEPAKTKAVKDEGDKTEYIIYEKLGDYYLPKNVNQAFLCYENAEFLCTDEQKKAVIKEKKEKLKAAGGVTVQKTAMVILSYNNMYLTQKCLESIYQNCAPDAYSIVVVDNASTDGVLDWLKEQPDILLIGCDENLGFPAGCNVGIEYADPKQDILLLNNDTRMTHNALFWLRMGLYENEHVGATGCIANYCGVDQLEDVMFSLPDDYMEYAKTINVPCENPYEEKNKLGGFAMLIKREALDRVGYLDEAFSPGYFEDDDISMRIHQAGYRLLVCHNSFIYHAGSQSFIKRTDLEEIFARNHEYMVHKWGYDNLIYSAMLEAENNILHQISHDRNDFFRLLEVGAGSGNALGRAQYLYPQAQIIGLEENEIVLHNAIESVPILCLDWKKDRLPFLYHSFDYIIYHDRWGENIPKETVTAFFAQYLKEDGKLYFVFE